MSTRKQITLAAFHEQLKAQGVQRDHLAFKCPICKTVQSATDLIAAGAGRDFGAVEKFLGFSCVGRWRNSGPWRKGDKPGRGCDWTLGGLLQLHDLEVVTEDGVAHPRFEPASPEEAKAHRTEVGGDV